MTDTMKRRVIHAKNLPVRIPIWSTATVWLLMDRFQVRGVWAGVVWTIWAILCVILLIGWWSQDSVDIFANERK